MFQTDNQKSSFEDQRGDINTVIRNSSEAACLKHQKSQENFNLNANYYYFLLNKNREAIERLMRQLQKEALKNAQLIKTLMKFLKGQITRFASTPEVIIQDLLSIIKEKIELSKRNLSQEQMKFYEYVLNDNKKAQSLIKRQWNILSEWTIQKLYYLDILSIFFHQGLSVLEKCKCTAIPISRDATTYLFGFSKNAVIKLLKIFKDSHQFIRQIENRAIYELVNIYHLIVIRNRMVSIVQRARKRAIDPSQYSLNKPDYQKEHRQNASFYNFCQIAFWSTDKDIQQQPYARKYEIIQYLLEANARKNDQNLSKVVLFVRIKYNLSFGSIFKLQNLIVNKQLKEIKHLLQSFQPSKTAELSAIFPYIFIKDETFDVSFEKSGLSKKYDLKNFERLLVSKMQAIFTFARVAFRQVRQSSVLLESMLKCQIRHNRELIIIKKLVISLHEITGLSKSAIPTPKKDLICNLILITNQNRILGWCIVREALKDEKYVRILNRIMKSISFKRQSVVVLYQNQLGQMPNWRNFYRFHAHLLKKYHFRLYVINSPLFCKLALLIFSYINIKIHNIRQSMTRKSFYGIVEEEITSNLHFLSRIVFPDY